MTILRDFCNDLGYVNVNNQYIELAVRYYEREHRDKPLQELAKTVNLSLSVLPEGYAARISRGYIVGIYSCFEKFLLDFKELPGNPTEKMDLYDPKKMNKLEWTLKACYGNNLPQEVLEYYHICNYYRLVRNHIIHGDGESAKYRMAKSQVEKLDKELLKSGMCDRLNAPNEIERLNFDDQVLFSRAARAIAERIFKDSEYDWEKILNTNKEKIESIVRTVRDRSEKRNPKIINYLAQMYPVQGREDLANILFAFKL